MSSIVRQNRRQWLRDSLVTATAASIAATASGDGRPSSVDAANRMPEQATWLESGAVDSNAHVGQWPFRHLADADLSSLTLKLKRLGFAQAWVASFDAVLHRDIAGVNARLESICRGSEHPLLIPFGSINPNLPDWEEDLRRCHEVHQMAGIRVYPGYHDYSLSSPGFERLLSLATRRGLLIQVALSLEDTRTQHPRMRVEDVDPHPLPALLTRHPNARLMLLNARLTPQAIRDLAECPQIHFDTARIDGTNGVANLARATSPQRVLLGTHNPFFIPEANLIKLYESDLSDTELGQVMRANAMRLLGNHVAAPSASAKQAR